jgi:hypothetical protein
MQARMKGTIYRPEYAQSWALVVGINAYQYAPPLACARRDAEVVAATLKNRFGFHEDHVTTLLDDDATCDALMSAFLDFAGEDVSEDARVVVFFAGHGHTRMGRRGEVGYLVPVDGDPNDPASLVRWDELTRNADLILAKHILFIMDACYGGLAVMRTLPPGSKRFLKDMLQRYSRQVLTAGKADETVADAGGPRAGHSMFTGHFLDAIDGAAATADGVVSANAVMAYVYDRVARDPHSRQTPHFGFLDGDGDLIFAAPILEKPVPPQQIDEDVLVAPLAFHGPDVAPGTTVSFADTIKEFLTDSRYRIRLSDLVRTEVRITLDELLAGDFSSSAALTTETFLTRIRAYESSVARLQDCVILIAHWGTSEHKATLELPLVRLAEQIEQVGGLTAWLGLRWYPIVLLMYSGGIAALAANNYSTLATLLTARLQGRTTGDDTKEAAFLASIGMLETTRADLFKRIPGHERHHTPASEYLFKALQPRLEDALFLGTAYERYFDKFEVIYSLVCADVLRKEGGSVWGPVGRFGWKQNRGYGQSPFESLIAEAEAAGRTWGPLRAGLFGGSIDYFKELVAAFRTDVLAHVRWF